MSKENKSFSEYTDADFELESVNFYESFLASEESQAVEETQKEKVATKKDKRVVIDKAEYQFGPHKATFKPLTKTPSIQGKKVGTIVETQSVNFSFEDGFQLTTLGQWEKYGTAKFQSNEVILQGSEISYVGQMPGSNSVETGKAKCTQSGQKKDYEGIDTTDAAFPDYKTEPKVINFYIANRSLDGIERAKYDDTIYLHINTYSLIGGKINLAIDSPNASYEYNGKTVTEDTFRDYTLKEEEEVLPLKVVFLGNSTNRAVSKFTLTVASIGYQKTVELQVKSLVQELHDDIIKKLNPNRYTGKERKYVEGALKHVDFLVDKNVILTETEERKPSTYTGSLNIVYPPDTSRDDIKISLFHEYLHHVNYMEKIYPYRYSDESNRTIFQIDDDCYIFGEIDMDKVFSDFITDNTIMDYEWQQYFSYEELPLEKKQKVLNFKQEHKDKYSEQCIKGTYMPSNYYRDEIAVYTICLQENHNLFIFSEKNEKRAYKPNLKHYKEVSLKNSINYERKNHYNERGFEK